MKEICDVEHLNLVLTRLDWRRCHLIAVDTTHHFAIDEIS